MSEKVKKTRLTATVEDELKEQVSNRCAIQGITITDYIETLVRRDLDEQVEGTYTSEILQEYFNKNSKLLEDYELLQEENDTLENNTKVLTEQLQEKEKHLSESNAEAQSLRTCLLKYESGFWRGFLELFRN